MRDAPDADDDILTLAVFGFAEGQSTLLGSQRGPCLARGRARPFRNYRLQVLSPGCSYGDLGHRRCGLIHLRLGVAASDIYRGVTFPLGF